MNSKTLIKIISTILFVIFILISCSFPNHTALKEIKNEFDYLWSIYLSSAEGGWENNDLGRFAWDDVYALDGVINLFLATKDSDYLDIAFSITDRFLNGLDTNRNIIDEYRENGPLPAWSSTRYSEGIPHIFLVHTGLITFSMTKLYNVVIENKYFIDSFYQNKALELLDYAIDAFNIHTSEWTDVNSNSGYFHDIYYKDYMKIDTPLNQYATMGMSALELYNATGDEIYKEKTMKMAQMIKNQLIQENNTYIWYYSNPEKTPMPRMDDTGHSQLVIWFINLCYKNELIFTQSDINLLVNTFLNNIYLGDGNVSKYIDSTGINEDPILSVFYYLSDYNFDVFEIMCEEFSETQKTYDENSFLNHLGKKTIHLFALKQYYNIRFN